jgi:phospholipase C
MLSCVPLGVLSTATIIPVAPAAADGQTATPIKHVIILIGENHSFDNVYGTYQPRKGQSVSNLLSKGIVNSAGQTVLNTQAQQFQISQPYPSKYFIDYHATAGKTVYPTLPPPVTSAAPTAPGPALAPPAGLGQAPFDSTVPDSLLPTLAPSLEKSDLGLMRTGATGVPPNAVDTRVTNAASLANGEFQVTGPNLPYDSFSGDGVHRFFHMWQQSDCSYLNNTPDNPSGCLNDLYPFVGIARNNASGGNSMAFYNMIQGDAPVLKKLADQYTLNDNYHQAVMGGTAVQHVMLGTADAIPWENVRDPDPAAGLNHY